MVRVLVDHDIVAVPKPVIYEVIIVRSNGEISAIKPEAAPVPSPQVENMTATKAAIEVSMFPWMIEMVVRIVTARVSNPSIIRVNVRSVRMSRPVGKAPVLRHGRLDSGWLLHSTRFRTTSGNMSTAKLTMLPTLRKGRTTLQEAQELAS